MPCCLDGARNEGRSVNVRCHDPAAALLPFLSFPNTRCFDPERRRLVPTYGTRLDRQDSGVNGQRTTTDHH